MLAWLFIVLWLLLMAGAVIRIIRLMNEPPSVTAGRGFEVKPIAGEWPVLQERENDHG